MANDIALIEEIILAPAVREAFDRVSAVKSITFEREAEFAIQIISKNDYAIKLAKSNRQSVIDAVTNLSAMGLTLNPARKQAYLVPRDGGICLDISYMGLVDLATDTGSVLWAHAEVVRENDVFKLNGIDQKPTHEFSPFSTDRGEAVGAYVCAKTVSGDYLTDAMSIADIERIRDATSGWKAYKSGKAKSSIWNDHADEMRKKTVVKRGSKMWPKSEKSSRLQAAIEYLNNDGGEGIINNAAPPDGSKPQVQLNVILDFVAKCATPTELQAAWERATDACRKANDLESHGKIKAAVLKRQEELKGNRK